VPDHSFVVVAVIAFPAIAFRLLEKEKQASSQPAAATA
jgi:hypothetical protein